MRLQNLDLLMRDMHDKEWHITAFTFKFGKVTATVLVEDVHCFKPKYFDIIARLAFHDVKDNTKVLKVEASNNYIHAAVSTIREFFGVDWVGKMQSFLEDFYKSLNASIPDEFPERLSSVEEKIVNELRNRGDKNNGTCIFEVKHNPNNGQRSAFNEDKAKKYCLDVYNEYKADTNISFCFREKDPLSLDEIRNNFAKNQQRLLKAGRSI